MTVRLPRCYSPSTHLAIWTRTTTFMTRSYISRLRTRTKQSERVRKDCEQDHDGYPAGSDLRGITKTERRRTGLFCKHVSCCYLCFYILYWIIFTLFTVEMEGVRYGK